MTYHYAVRYYTSGKTNEWKYAYVFYVKSGEKISTNDTCNHALGNLPNDPILCKLSLKGKMCIILMMVRHV